MEVKPGYKQTDVGVIPEEWEVSSVGREFDIKLGKMLDAEKNVGVPKPYLGNKAVHATGGVFEPASPIAFIVYFAAGALVLALLQGPSTWGSRRRETYVN